MMTPVQLAISNGHVEAFKILWEELERRGEKARFLESHISLDRYGWSILGWAVHSGDLEAVDYILSLKLPGMGIDSQTPPVITAALTKGNIPLIRHLIDLGADPNSQSERHHNPLISAVRRGLLDVTKTLVEYGKADLELRDLRGNTAMDVAEKCGQYECAAYLRAMRLKLGLVSPADQSRKDFTVQLKWFRPRIQGSILSPRTFPNAVLIDQKRIYIAGGQGLPEGEVNVMPDNYAPHTLEELHFALYTIDLPARDEPMLPIEALPVHLSMTQAYATTSQNPAPGAPTAHKFRAGIRDTNRKQAVSTSTHQLWSTQYGSDLIGLDESLLEAYYIPSQVASPSVALAQKPLPPTLPFPYFEITIMELGQYGYIAIGLSTICDDIDQHLGWTATGYGLHGDIGCIFHSSSTGAAFSPRFQKGDVIGCGLDMARKEVFYTRNGQYLGTSHQGVDTSLAWFPAISMQSPGEKVRANFGSESFWFDFVAPTLHINPMKSTPDIWTSYNGRAILAEAPQNRSPFKVAVAHLRGKVIYYLHPPPPITHDLLEVPSSGKTSAEWKRFDLRADPQSPHDAYAFWSAVPASISEDITHLSTTDFLYIITQKGDSVTQKVQLNMWAIEWATNIVFRVDLPALTWAKRNDGGTPRVEMYFDDVTLASWVYTMPQVMTINTSDLISLVRNRETHKEVAPEWTCHVPQGSHPLSSRLAASKLSSGQGIIFGGFEETAPQNIVQLLDCSSGTPTWSRPRTEGTTPRARFFTTTIIQHEHAEQGVPQNSGNQAGADATAGGLSAAIATNSPTLNPVYPPHLKGDDHDHTLYVLGGWNGWSCVSDIDIAHVYTPKASLEEALSIINDFTIICNDGSNVATSKILLYCRSSLFRDFFKDHKGTCNSISFLDILPSIPISGPLMRAIISYFASDIMLKPDADSILLLQAVEIICPEHSGRIHDQLFSGRIIHNSTLNTDWLRSLETDCVIKPDIKFLARSETGEEKPVFAHAYIAALHSSFFKAIISGDYQESRMEDGVRTVRLQTDYELARMLVPGLCSGEVDLGLVGDRIIDLFELSHALQVHQLISFLESVLRSNIDQDNVQMLESVAIDHNATKLLEACKDFRASEKAIASALSAQTSHQ
jgi:ankyrin repeat protein